VSAKTAGLKKLVAVPKHAAFAPHIAGVDGVPITQAIPAIAGDINGFWSHELANSGVQYPQAEEVLVQTSAVQDPCTNSAIAPGDPAAYCGQGSAGQPGGAVTFYWTVPWMQQNLDTDPGRVNLTFDMAQFWSLYVQDVIGSTNALSSGKMTKAQYAEQNSCLTGLYARSLANRQLIEKGDTQTANNWVSTLSSSANGITAPDVTSAQLQQAFITGFQSGDPSRCASSGASGTKS
jgi:predicted metalloprotease